jgi:hypothetical protein
MGFVASTKGDGSGTTQSVTLTPSGSNKALIIIATAFSGNVRTLDTITIGGKSGTILVNASKNKSGGNAISTAVVSLKDVDHPGSGVQSIVSNWSDSVSAVSFTVLEYDDIDQTAFIAGFSSFSEVDTANNAVRSVTLTSQIGNHGIAYAASTGQATASGSGHVGGANLTPREKENNGKNSTSVETDASVASSSEQYDFTMNHDGNTMDSIMIGTFALIPISASTVSITDISPAVAVPGDPVVVTVADGTGPYTATYNSEAVTIDSQDATTITFDSWQYPWDRATADVDFDTNYDLVITDTGDGDATDTASLQTTPAAGEDYHTITGEPWDETSIYFDDHIAFPDLTNGDKHWGYVVSGSMEPMGTNGVAFRPVIGTVYRYRLYNVSASLWGAVVTPDETWGALSIGTVVGSMAGEGGLAGKGGGLVS